MSIRIYDISGRIIATLVEGEIQAGCHSVTWEAASFATGVYLVRMEASRTGSIRWFQRGSQGCAGEMSIASQMHAIWWGFFADDQQVKSPQKKKDFQECDMLALVV